MSIATTQPDAPVVPLETPIAPTDIREAWTDPMSRPLDALAITLVLIMCMSWGFNNVAIKLATPDIPPLMQATIRSVGGTLFILLWMYARGIPLKFNDETLKPGLLIGALFAIEYVLIYRGLVWTTASRSVFYLYTAPIFVAVGARWFLPGERLTRLQWISLILSFAGIFIAFRLGSPRAHPSEVIGDAMILLAAVAAAGTTIVAKATALVHASYAKTLFYQLVASIPVSAVASLLFREEMTGMPSWLAVGMLTYQTLWVVGITFLAWYALIQCYSATRLAAFTFLTPIFGVAAGHFFLDEPLTPGFLFAVALVTVATFLPSLHILGSLHYLREKLRGRRP
jgi:drug/metabolite transporter (DMT)-like permease